MKTVLIVDDTKTVLMAEKMMLMGQNYSIQTAGNGLEALQYVNKEMPDMILLDIVMPKMNGIDFCKFLRSMDHGTDVPVIMVTTKGEESMIQQAFAAGCNDYVTKPIDKLTLLTKMRCFM